MTNLITEAIQSEINKMPDLKAITDLCESKEIFSNTNAEKTYWDFCPYNFKLKAIPKFSQINDPYIKQYLQEKYQHSLFISDFIIITKEDVGSFMEPNYIYKAQVIKDAKPVAEIEFSETDLETDISLINVKILALAKNSNIATDKVFEYQEGDCGETATVPWKI